MDAAVKKLQAQGLSISPEIRARLSPLVHEHINFYLDDVSVGDGLLVEASRPQHAGDQAPVGTIGNRLSWAWEEIRPKGAPAGAPFGRISSQAPRPAVCSR
ncbi:hypothetical protein [Streptomyces sp. NPDC057909]|uniref:hypothetical protein n=1 Tax=Streptomyces sp. NPDC057909 TaxID=3346277 RepID=UPI0036EFCDCD